MKFGIICAMDEEIKELKKALNNPQEKTINGVKFYTGKIYNQPVVLVKSGIGKVAAGITAEMLIDNFDVNVIIHSGSAAGIGQDLKVGDIVVSTETAYHDVDATASGYKYGQLPGQPARFVSSKIWGDKLKNTTKPNNYNLKQGLIVTGDQFISGKKQIDNILKKFPDALAAEMEGAAIGQVARKFDIPYVVVRSISDVGDENANQSFDKFLNEAGYRSAKLVIELLKNENDKTAK